MDSLRADPASPHLFTRRPRLTLLIAVLVAVGVSGILHLLGDGDLKLDATPAVSAILGDPGSPQMGAAHPDLTIVVFTDYQCPICKATDPALEDLLARDRRVRIIYKDWPIFGPASQAAARVALAADRQGKYLAFHRALMSSRVKLDDAEIQRAALKAGLDWPRVETDLRDRDLDFRRQLARQGTQAFSIGLQGTPGYLVGPYLINRGLDAGQLAVAVARARHAGP
jgi:protein-disulfide isomerase